MERLWWFRHQLQQMAHDVEVAHQDMVTETAMLIVRRPKSLMHYQHQENWARELQKTYPNIRCRVGKTGLLVKVGIS